MSDYNAAVDFQTEFQDVADETCGPMCVKNVLTHFGINKELSHILKDLNITKDDYTTEPQLALYLQKHHQELTIELWSDTPFVTPDGIGITPSEILANLEQRAMRYRKEIEKGAPSMEASFIGNTQFVIDYLRAKGRLHCQTITTTVIDDLLNQGYLLIAGCTNSKLWGKLKVLKELVYDPVQGNAEGHFVVIYGKTDDEYLISDPYPTGIAGKEGNYPLPKSELLAALYWSLQILAIKIDQNDTLMPKKVISQPEDTIDFDKIKTDIEGIGSLQKLAKHNNWRIVVAGGFALDILLGQITRNHGDVDVILYGTADRKQARAILLEHLAPDQNRPFKVQEDTFFTTYELQTGTTNFNIYYVQTVVDPMASIQKVKKADGTVVTNSVDDFPPPVLGKLDNLEIEVQHPRARLDDILAKRERSGHRPEHDQDIKNLKILMTSKSDDLRPPLSLAKPLMQRHDF